MAYVFVADDFTGASDTLATLARGGYRARLFRDLPVGRDLEGIEAWGIATQARALGRGDMAALAARIGAGLRRFEPGFLHLKICSTFDSSPEVGNIALLAQVLADAAGLGDLAVLGGQPSLGRHAVFGTLFARGPDGRIHRIDRHPVMAIHPVTPMHEADLIRHLASLGLNDLHHVPRGARGGAFPRFYDALDQADVVAAGQDLMYRGQRLLVMGASSVAEAWIAAQPPRPRTAPTLRRAERPILCFAGSRSSLTTTQIGAAEGLARLPVNPADVMAQGPGLATATAWARERLARGQDCLLYLTAENSGGIAPADLATASAGLVLRILDGGAAGGLVVAGGDTSSAIVTALSPDWLEYAAELCPGVAILQAQIGEDRMSLALKGGQMGGADFFAQAIAAMRAPKVPAA